jgi:predicted short-subunit dehydrogenase-like oxidoreductase (DUF2520 family)
LAYHVNAAAINRISDIDDHTDMFIIAINDDEIKKVAAALRHFKKMMVHTSGATSLQILTDLTDNCGVFYPLQTFSKTKEVDFRSVPLCIEGSSAEITDVLFELGKTISNSVQFVDSAQRKVLHLSAVFACNFTNHMYQIAQVLLAQNGLPFDLLRPLIMETAQKVQHNLPADVQTGPAIRHDQHTMDAHLKLLNNNGDLQRLYVLLSQNIIKNENDARSDR